MCGLQGAPRVAGLCKCLENGGDFAEIRACFRKSLEFNKTNSIRRVLYGVIKLEGLCKSVRDVTEASHPALFSRSSL